MQTALSGLLSAGGQTAELSNWKRVFGGNARRAYSFDALRNDRSLPCIMLSQVAAKHIDSDSAREFAVLKALNGSGVRSPEAIAVDLDGAATGSPAIVLERVEGEASAVGFLKMQQAEGQTLSADLARATGDLHRFDWLATELDPESADPIQGQIDHWEAAFQRNRLEPLPVLAWLFRWLRENAPAPSRLSLVHGDLRPGNFLYQGDRLTALLDWEMAHIGDPAEDIAWIYRALWSPERFMPLDEFLAIHAEQARFIVPRTSVMFYRIFSEVKFATISVAAANSFASGGTSNLRHIGRAAIVPQCLTLAMDWIRSREWSERHAAA
ncbi:phosphotransferase family protein [Sphingobium phenoxybenzoativorans]|uniref:Phosphotransferase family protein n=1 Tax=Sphingobium phenoxybenzoativorans TaxID=1592790 RepID=A0A975K8Q6_9SPHN|nr:phosphotransferase family protein [Sphingobium phenoxybenzoativorans]QUT06869.1 phosphotransferase family protein [Sphingobium phenoxybenzoativorans]